MCVKSRFPWLVCCRVPDCAFLQSAKPDFSFLGNYLYCRPLVSSILWCHLFLCSQVLAQATELRAQSSELRAQSSELRAQSSELRAQSSEPRQCALIPIALVEMFRRRAAIAKPCILHYVEGFVACAFFLLLRLSSGFRLQGCVGFAVVEGCRRPSRTREDLPEEHRAAKLLFKRSEDDIPLGTDTDPSNYTNLWLAGRASEYLSMGMNLSE